MLNPITVLRWPHSRAAGLYTAYLWDSVKQTKLSPSRFSGFVTTYNEQRQHTNISSPYYAYSTTAGGAALTIWDYHGRRALCTPTHTTNCTVTKPLPDAAPAVVHNLHSWTLARPLRSRKTFPTPQRRSRLVTSHVLHKRGQY